MTAPLDPDRQLRAFLDEGATELPDRVYDAVRVDIDRTRQRAVIGSWRVPNMSAIPNLATAAIALVLAAAVGVNVLPRSGGVGNVTVSPSAAPSPSPETTPAPSLTAYTWPANLVSGTYSTDFAFDLPVAATFTVGDGWQARDINLIKGDHVSLMFLVVDNVFSDPCSGVLADPPLGPTIEDLTGAMAAMPGIDATTPAAASLGDLTGTYLEYSLRADAGCTPDSARVLHLVPLVCDTACGGVGSRDVGFEFPSAGVTGRMWVLDAGGRLRLVIQAIVSPEASEAELAELQGVIASVEIARTAPPTPAPQPASS